MEEILKRLFNKKTKKGISYDIKTILDFNILKSKLSKLSPPLYVTDGQIIKAFRQVDDINLLSKENFINIIKDVIQRDLDDDKKKKWKVLMPINILLPKRKIKINGQLYQIKTYNSLSNFKNMYFYQKLPFDKDSKYEPIRLPSDSISFLITESYGKTLYSAWKKINPSFSVLKGIVDYILTFSSWTYISPDISRSKMSYPEQIYGISNFNEQEYFELIVNKNHRYKKKFFEKQKQNLNKILKIQENIPKEKSIEYLLMDCFRLYHHGMDEKIVEYSFIRFWQLLERLSFPKEGKTPETSIVKRINLLSKIHFNENLDTYIKSLSDKRNDFIHHGIEYITEDDLNFVKALCEYTIRWIIHYRKEISTINHLEEFYRKKDTSNKDLEVTKDILKFIADYRKK